MVLKDLLAISGYSGVFRFISQGRNGIIVESVETKKRMNAPATAKISSLEDIAIYTDDEEVPLAEVFDKIYEKENGGKTINHKSSPDELKEYMSQILPDYDKERVYVSDIKKMVNWYNQLHQHNLLVKEEKKDNEGEGNNEPEDEKESTNEQASNESETSEDKNT